MSSNNTANLFAVGCIIGSFGVRGYVKVKPLTDSSERFKKLRLVYRGFSPENVVSAQLDYIEIRDRYILVRLDDVNDRSDAQKLKGQYLFIPGDDAEIPNHGRYFVHDIIGCNVQSADGKYIGTITEVYKLPAHDLWEIKSVEKQFLIPAVKEFIIAVDAENKTVIVKVIEGLMDT